MRRTLVLALAAWLLAGCVPPAQDRLEEQIAEDAGLLAIQDRGTLRVGIPLDPPGLGAGSEGSPEGLAAEAATWMADPLGVEVEFEYGTTETILAAIHDERLDLAFPVMPITEGAARSQKRSYTAPVFVAHQRVLAGPGVGEVDRAEKACVFGDARTQVPVENISPNLTAVRSNDGDGCARLLSDGIVDVIVAPDVLLFELEATLQGTTLLPAAYNSEGYSAVVQFGQIGVANFFDAVLARAIDDGRWMDAFENNLAPLTDLQVEPPDLTAEEAAALFPRGLPLS